MCSRAVKDEYYTFIAVLKLWKENKLGFLAHGR
jgi:hypothetical protein